jgi:3',5'-cyclic AMP phosphodiesterase CpdA
MFDAYKNRDSKRDIRLPKLNLLESSESIFADNFMQPSNGPISEDNSWVDRDSYHINFPSYKENVYSFVYGNSAFIILNSNYWFTPRFSDIEKFGGNPHGYIMDNQLKWFSRQVRKFSRNKKIAHIFVALHTPLFPNGGHAKNDMWYRGDNKFRPYANGKPAKYGIIQRRDQLLKIIDRSKKVVAVLTGDEHNYSLLKVAPQMPRYSKTFKQKKIKLHRHFWQITNGTAGAPYYGQEKLPWSKWVKEFSSEHLLSVFRVRGEKVFLESINPLTLKTFSKIRLK